MLEALAQRGDALRCAIAEAPDAIVMDLAMPVVDGYTATRLLKGDARTRHIPVIAVTAHAMEEERLRCLDAGFTDFLSKPVYRNELIDKILRHRLASTGT